MFSMKTISKYLFLMLFAFVALSCNDDDNPKPAEEESEFSALVAVGAWPNIAYYIASVPSLTSGQINLEGNGAEISGKVYAQDVIQHHGYYYHANAGSGRLGKYHVESGALITDAEIVFTSLDWSATTWIDDNTLGIFGTKETEVRYSIVNVSTMAVVKEGALDVTALSGNMAQYAVSFAQYRDGKVFLGYNLMSGWENYPEMDVNRSVLVAVINYSTMAVEKTIEDDRSSTPGGPNVYAPTVFIDEKNDLYIVTDPVYNYDFTSPSAIYRIRNGQTEFDDSYFYNLSADTDGGMGAAFWYIGNGEAIVRTRIAGESIDAEHNFTVVNVQTGNFVEKLNLPADRGERMVQAVIVQDDKAYIAVNADANDYIWEYDPATNNLSQGAEFVGGVDFILRLEKIVK